MYHRQLAHTSNLFDSFDFKSSMIYEQSQKQMSTFIALRWGEILRRKSSSREKSFDSHRSQKIKEILLNNFHTYKQNVLDMLSDTFFIVKCCIMLVLTMGLMLCFIMLLTYATSKKRQSIIEFITCNVIAAPASCL